MKFTNIRFQVICILIFSIVCNNAFAQREMSKEAITFLATRDAVCTVFGDRSQGSGFLVDKAGLILTNSHVITNSSRLSVQIEPKIRVRAILLVDDKQKDISVLHVNPNTIKDLPILKIAARPTHDLAFEGEKVICIGSPLNQIRIVTSGIVSKMEEQAVISDVNINPGNSGGPMINMDSEVIAINTFGDFSSRGPGVSGSIPITLAEPILAMARKKLNQIDTPSSDLLPVVPKYPFPIEGLKWASARSGKTRNYVIDGLRFNIIIYTPTREHYLKIVSADPLVKKRQIREKSAGVDPSEIYDPVGDNLQEWQQYVGEFMPLVLIKVEPKIGETGGSLFLNVLGATAAAYSKTAYRGFHTYEYKSDLQDFDLIDNSSTIPAVFRSMGIVPVSVSTSQAKMEDIAQHGLFAFRPEVFNSTNFRMKFKDLKNPGKVTVIPIPRACREQILIDFEPYFDMIKAKQAKLNLPRY